MSFPENTKDSFKSRGIMREFTGSSRIISPETSATNPRILVPSPAKTEIDCSQMHIHRLKATTTVGSYTVVLANMSEGQSVSVVINSSGTAYSMLWTDAAAVSVKWPPTGVPVPTAIASRYDVYTFMKVGGMIFGSALLQMG
jgi:hypothetical protein